MDRTGALPDSLQGQDLEPFRWTVNAGWGGKPTGCDFKTTDITPVFRYDKSYNKSTFDFKKREVIGEFDIDLNEDTCPGIEDDIFKSDLDSTIHIGCKWGGFDIGIHDRDKIECRIHDRGVSGYCLETLKSDTIDTRVEIRYLNGHEVK
jgi:hypothetical protein